MPVLYHHRLGFPKNIKIKYGTLRLTYTKHAVERAKESKYDKIVLPEKIDTDQAQAIEVEVGDDGMPQKILYRASYSALYEMCMAVVIPSGIVKTIWLNRCDDNHNTLDVRKYGRAG